MLLSIALPVPLFRTFTYSAPDSGAARARPGHRAVVPFRNETLLGVILGPAEPPPPDSKIRIKPIKGLPDDKPVMSPSMIELCRWIADYYVAPLGIVLRSALPAALSAAADPTPSQKTRRTATIARELPTLMERDAVFKRAPQQRALYELLESLGGRAAVEHLVEKLDFSPAVLNALKDKKLITIGNEVIERDPFALRDTGPQKDLAPTPEQSAAIRAIRNGNPGDVFLLHGITGSGKTLVYIELLKEIVEKRNQTAIVLVPEIALTPQTVDRFRAVFGDRIAVLHSALSDGERYDAWLALQRGERRIAVGARSAIFAPLANLGAIIVDEEHESSYKQGETPRYHAREVAIMRAKLEGAVTVLGSATPSLESWVNVASGKYTKLSLPERVGGGRLPRVDVVDLRAARKPRRPNEPPDAFRWVFSEELETAIADTIRKGEQVILLLNRRGYSAFVQCGDCGDVPACPNCSISLTYHRLPERLVCHYCGHHEPPRTTCDKCSGSLLRQRGLGTQQVERLLAERFASARIARMDVDTTSGKWAHAEILDRVGAGEVDILLGTQMIAKGLDFPNVTLVGVVDADVGINLPDFRASERCFQLLAQVAGRAGRGPKGGRVLIQTREPEHHAVRCAVTHDYEKFVREELDGRARPAYPPMVRLANVVFSGTTEEDTAALAAAATEWLQRLLAKRARGAVQLIGPAPAPIERIKNRWRWHLLLRSEHAGELGRVSRYFVERFDVPSGGAQLRVILDRDPVALL